MCDAFKHKGILSSKSWGFGIASRSAWQGTREAQGAVWLITLSTLVSHSNKLLGSGRQQGWEKHSEEGSMGNRSLHIYPGPDLVDGFRIVKSSSAFAAVHGAWLLQRKEESDWLPGTYFRKARHLGNQAMKAKSKVWDAQTDTPQWLRKDPTNLNCKIW